MHTTWLNQRLKNFFLAILCISFLPSFGQGDKETAQQMVEIADEIMTQTHAVIEARELYISAADMDPDNLRANYMAGMTTLESINKSEATPYLLNVLERDPNYRFDLLYRIGQSYHFGYKFDDAIDYYNRYLKKVGANKKYEGSDRIEADVVDRKIYECEKGKILVEFPEDVKISNLGASVNSEFDDYAPLVDGDESILIFTSRRKDGNLSDDVAEDNLPYEDIFFSQKTGDTWGPAQNIGTTINTPFHDSNVGLSKDGKRLYVYKNDENGFGDIYVSERDDAGNWSLAEPMSKEINSEYSETTVSDSPDGNTLFFASNREGGEGGFDIWVTQKNRKGDWGKPVNLGPDINTKYDEDGPFIGYDGKTLYYSSRGGEGMGGFDIYRTEYDSTSKRWDAPANMGYPINTPDEDIYFTPTKDGKRAYYSSIRDQGFGYTDIYMLKVPEVLKHEDTTAVAKKKPTVAVTLKVTTLDETGAATEANVSLRPRLGGADLPVVQGEQGVFVFSSYNDNTSEYSLVVSKPGYIVQNLGVTLPASGEESMEVTKIVQLVKKKQKIPARPKPKPKPKPNPVTLTMKANQLRNIYFDFNKVIIKPEYGEKVEKAASYMKSHTASTLLLIGHSDKVGTEKYNIALSENRAKEVRAALIKRGVAGNRISVKGEGSAHPLASNDQEREGRELNRRVEFRVSNQ